jgi:hypothetical protein
MLELSLARMWKGRGKYLIYALDDDLLNVPNGLSSSEYYHRPEVRTCIAEMIALCDCFVSPSKKLLAMYAVQEGKSFCIEEPVLFDAVHKSSDESVLKIGFAGSIDRRSDVDRLLSYAIERLCRDYSDAIRIEFFGAHPEIVDKLKLTWYPYCDSYTAYQEKMLELNWDIALAPMPDTPFHSCKHYNKLIEYAGCGIAGVYSDALPYHGAIEDGVTGLLCENTTEAWYSAISKLITDVDLRNNISANCLEMAGSAFSLEHTSMALWNALERAGAKESDRVPIMEARTVIRREKYKKIVSAVKRYGLRTPAVAVEKAIKSICSHR